MPRWMIGLALLLAACGTAAAQAPTADCTTYKRMSDGRWMSLIRAKIGNPKQFMILEPGLPINRDMTIVGINVSDTLDRLCGKR